jgi:hypothetical protein
MIIGANWKMRELIVLLMARFRPIGWSLQFIFMRLRCFFSRFNDSHLDDLNSLRNVDFHSNFDCFWMTCFIKWTRRIKLGYFCFISRSSWSWDKHRSSSGRPRMAVLPTNLGSPGRQTERKNPSRTLESDTRCGYWANEQFSKRYYDARFEK